MLFQTGVFASNFQVLFLEIIFGMADDNIKWRKQQTNWTTQSRKESVEFLDYYKINIIGPRHISVSYKGKLK